MILIPFYNICITSSLLFPLYLQTLQTFYHTIFLFQRPALHSYVDGMGGAGIAERNGSRTFRRYVCTNKRKWLIVFCCDFCPHKFLDFEAVSVILIISPSKNFRYFILLRGSTVNWNRKMHMLRQRTFDYCSFPFTLLYQEKSCQVRIQNAQMKAIEFRKNFICSLYLLKITHTLRLLGRNQRKCWRLRYKQNHVLPFKCDLSLTLTRCPKYVIKKK